MKLIGSRLLVRRIPPRLTTPTGLHLLAAYEDHDKLYRVMQVGNGVEDIRAGDAVFVPEYGFRADIGDGSVIIEQREVMAVIREE